MLSIVRCLKDVWISSLSTIYLKQVQIAAAAKEIVQPLVDADIGYPMKSASAVFKEGILILITCSTDFKFLLSIKS